MGVVRCLFDRGGGDSAYERGGGGGGGGGGAAPLHMNGMGMLVVSLKGVNVGFWPHLGCSGQNAIIFSCEGLI